VGGLREVDGEVERDAEVLAPVKRSGAGTEALAWPGSRRPASAIVVVGLVLVRQS
jgi:hypothetical protein